MDLFMKIFGTIIYILWGTMALAYTYVDENSPKLVLIFARICATIILILGPIVCWMVW